MKVKSDAPLEPTLEARSHDVEAGLLVGIELGKKSTEPELVIGWLVEEAVKEAKTRLFFGSPVFGLDPEEIPGNGSVRLDARRSSEGEWTPVGFGFAISLNLGSGCENCRREPLGEKTNPEVEVRVAVVKKCLGVS